MPITIIPPRFRCEDCVAECEASCTPSKSQTSTKYEGTETQSLFGISGDIIVYTVSTPDSPIGGTKTLQTVNFGLNTQAYVVIVASAVMYTTTTTYVELLVDGAVKASRTLPSEWSGVVTLTWAGVLGAGGHKAEFRLRTESAGIGAAIVGLDYKNNPVPALVVHVVECSCTCEASCTAWCREPS